MAFVLSLFPRDFIQFMALPVYVVVLLMLLAVEAIGFVGGGSQRWLNLGFMQLQPSELMKPAVVLILARYYASLPVGMIPTWSALIAPGAMILTPVALVLLQPDLGTSLAIVFGGAMVMFAAGLPLRWFVGAAAAGAVLAPVAFFFGLQPYSRNGSSLSSIPRAIRWAMAITSRSRRSRSVRAGFRARGLTRDRKATSIIFPSRTPTSSSPPWRRNGASSADSWYSALSR